MRHRLPLARVAAGSRLCLKSPEITFVLPELAALFPEASFVLAYRSPLEIAESMYRLGHLVKRFPVYHARWRQEAAPPPGIPPEWSERWDRACDFARCVLYVAAYLAALADGTERLARRRFFLYDHAELRRRPRAVLDALARFLQLVPEGLADAAVRAEPRPVDGALAREYEALANDMAIEALLERVAALKAQV